jgi:alginate biosynthesis protein AlgK
VSLRQAASVGLAVAVLLGACKSVHVTRGLPTVAKSTDGMLVHGAEGAPDLERGNQARMAGRLDDAERDLLPLAERGYPDAQLYIAAIYSQKESPAAQDTAIQWYRKVLPQRPEADVPLARVLMHRGDRASVLEAEKLLLNAQRKRHEPSADIALLDLYGMYPQFDARHQAPALAKAASRSKLADVRVAAINWYRSSLADPDNARRLMELCRSNKEATPLCYVDLALYYRYAQQPKELEKLIDQALAAWQDYRPDVNPSALEPDEIVLPAIAGRLAMSMVDQPLEQPPEGADEDLQLQTQIEAQIAETEAEENPDARVNESVPQTAPVAQPAAMPGNAHPELADKILRWMLKQGGAMSVEAAGIAVGYPYLLPDVNLEEVLNKGVAANIAHASLYLGQLYYFNQRTPRNAKLGEESLKRALQYRETNIPGHYRLGRLYQQGYLGKPDPQKALDNFLYAARRRVTAADSHLARLFYDTPGAKINRINSYVFARLAEDAGVTVVIRTLHNGQLGSYKLLDRLRKDLTPEELRRAEQLYQQECEVHLVNRPPVSPQVWVKAVNP